MGVFTTQTLLSSVGVSRQATPGAIAINWILKVRMMFIHFTKYMHFLNSSLVLLFCKILIGDKD